jgi:hypothetical protein
MNCLPGMASNLDPAGLCLQSNQVYRHELAAPGLLLCSSIFPNFMLWCQHLSVDNQADHLEVKYLCFRSTNPYQILFLPFFSFFSMKITSMFCSLTSSL